MILPTPERSGPLWPPAFRMLWQCWHPFETKFAALALAPRRGMCGKCEEQRQKKSRRPLPHCHDLALARAESAAGAAPEGSACCCRQERRGSRPVQEEVRNILRPPVPGPWLRALL